MAFLLRPLSEHVAAVLSARDLACLCATSTDHRRASTSLVMVATKEQHGLAIYPPDNKNKKSTVADLFALEKTPNRCSLNLKKAGTRKVVNGAGFCEILVGSHPNLITQAQPPACHDEWSVEVMLRKGHTTHS